MKPIDNEQLLLFPEQAANMTKSVILEDVCGGWACEDQMYSEAEMGMVELGAYSSKEERRAKVTQGILCKEQT